MNGLAGESLKAKIQEFKSFFSEFVSHACQRARSNRYAKR
ncbi:hypothetical protein MWE_1298 [Helicobacter pylori XZ274]|nr:hypothetical protein MWE_1298 [Helicobacter pylori XZ274]